MGTTDNFDSPASGSIALTDTFPVISTATGRAATATVAQLKAAPEASIVAASTVSNLNYGITSLSSSTGAFTLGVPAAGVRKIISALVASTAARTINAGTGATYDGTNNVLTSTGIQTVELLGMSTTRWNIISNYSPTTGAMTLSTA
jgi:hypothetical protein